MGKKVRTISANGKMKNVTTDRWMKLEYNQDSLREGTQVEKDHDKHRIVAGAAMRGWTSHREKRQREEGPTQHRQEVEKTKNMQRETKKQKRKRTLEKYKQCS